MKKIPAIAVAATCVIGLSLVIAVIQVNAALKKGGMTGQTVLPATCTSLSRNFQLGARDSQTGGEVTKLQKFLKAERHFTGTVNGIFSTSTQVALGKWQVSEKIASPGTEGYGAVGPKTKTAIYTKSCNPIPEAPLEKNPLNLSVGENSQSGGIMGWIGGQLVSVIDGLKQLVGAKD